METFRRQNKKIKVAYSCSKGVYVQLPPYKIVRPSTSCNVEEGFVYVDVSEIQGGRRENIAEMFNVRPLITSIRCLDEYRGQTLPQSIHKGTLKSGAVVYKEQVDETAQLRIYFEQGTKVERERTPKGGANVHYKYLEEQVEDWEVINLWQQGVLEELLHEFNMSKTYNDFQVSAFIKTLKIKVKQLHNGVYFAEGRHSTLYVWSNRGAASSVWLPKWLLQPEQVQKHLELEAVGAL